MITVANASKTYTLKNKQVVAALDDVSLEINRGEFVIITGRSGSGKTTLLNLVAGLTRPTGGQVLVNGTEIWKLPDDQQAHLRNKQIGFVFQFPSLLPSLTVLENVMLPALFNEKNGKADLSQRALSLLEQIGLSDKRDAYPRQLSAGQQQRAVIARALIHEPELLLADEPTSNLDEQTEREVMALFKEIHNQTGITILLVTHTNDLVPYGTRAVRMAGGKIAAN